MPPPREDHREVVLIRGCDDLGISDGAAWLNDGFGPGRRNGIKTIPERKEGVRRRDRPCE